MKSASTHAPLLGISVVLTAGFLLFIGCAVHAPPLAEVHHRAENALRRSDHTARIGENRRTHGEVAPQARLEANATVPPQNAPQPGWITDASREFPPGRFLTAVGRGIDRRGAEDRARTEIARYFRSEVEASRRTREILAERSEPHAVKVDLRIHSEEHLRIATRQTLAGIWIARVHAVPSPNEEYYALAVLDRQQAAEVAAAEIRRLDEEMHTALAALDGRRNRFDRIRTLQACLGRHDRRAQYAAELRLLRPDQTVSAPEVSREHLKSQLERFLREDFSIAVSVCGDGAGWAGPVLIAALTQKGFAVRTAAQAQLFVRGVVELEPEPDRKGTWKFFRWHVRLVLTGAEGKIIYVGVERSGREGHLSYSQAEGRARRAVEAALSGDVAGRFDAWIRGKTQ